MQLKTTEINGKTYAELIDGKPIYVHDDGREVGFDAPSTVATISRLNKEAKSHRERAEAAQDALKPFEGIEDAEAARKALATIKNLDAKKLVDAGEIEKIRAEVIKAVEDKYSPVTKERDRLKLALENEKIGGAFTRSKLIQDRLAIPSDMVEARFRNAFKIEGDDVVAYDHFGNKIYSKERIGEVAAFDEALSVLIDQYPYRDHILRGTGANGGDSRGSGRVDGKRVVTRAEFNKLPPVEQHSTAIAAGKGELLLID